MPSGLNVLIVSGNLGRDPDMHYTPQGTAVTKLSVAVNRWDGKQEVTSWLPVVVFGKIAESCGTYLNKGSKVEVIGELSIRKYQDKDGVDRLWTECIASKVVFLSSKGSGAGAPPEPPPDSEEYAGEEHAGAHF